MAKELSLKQKLTAKYYTDIDSDTRGNKYLSYAKAFKRPLKDEKQKSSCKTLASRLFTNVDFLAFLNQKIDTTVGLDDKTVDRELKWLLLQRENHSAKVAAIREYNKLRQRYSFEYGIQIEDTVEENGEVKEKSNVKVITVKFAG